jgi:hypothetical protein
MPSEADFLNDALAQIGASVITAIDDGSVNANHCARLWPARRRMLIRMHNWQWADARATLSQGPTPAFEFAYSYPLPSDYIKLREYNGAEISTTAINDFTNSYLKRFKIEGASIFTNDGEVKIVYSRDVENPNLWDALFYPMAATWLASILAMAITKDAAKSKELLQQAVGMGLPMAAAVDSQEQSVHPFVVDDLLRVR